MVLSGEHRERVKQALGSTTSLLAAAAARIVMAPPGAKTWTNTDVAGILTFTIDRQRGGSKIIRLYELGTNKVLFDEELSTEMVYKQTLPYFHCFQINGALVGIDFSDEREALIFASKVNAMVPATAAAVDERRIGPQPTDDAGILSGFKKKIGWEQQQQRKLKISRPTNVEHLQHIGYDPDKGFDVSNIPPEWKSLFVSAGLTEADLADKDTAQAVIQTIQDYENQKAALSVSVQDEDVTDSRSAFINTPPPPPPRKAQNAPPAPPPPSRRVPRRQPDTTNREKPSPRPTIPRNNLLEQIQQGAVLKKTQVPDVKELPTDEKDELANKIRSMMLARRAHLQSPEPEDASEDDDDW